MAEKEKVSVGSGRMDECVERERTSKYKSVIASRAWVDGNYIEVDTKEQCKKWQSAFRRDGYFTYRRETKGGRWRAYILKSRARKSAKHAHHAKQVAARRDTGIPGDHRDVAVVSDVGSTQTKTGEVTANG